MPRPTDPRDTAELLLTDGRRVQAPAVIAGRVRGIDADGDLLIPLGDPSSPIRHENGAEYLIPLTPCCHTSAKGAGSGIGVVCRRCYSEVHSKYGGPGQLDTAVTDSCR